MDCTGMVFPKATDCSAMVQRYHQEVVLANQEGWEYSKRYFVDMSSGNYQLYDFLDLLIFEYDFRYEEVPLAKHCIAIALNSLISVPIVSAWVREIYDIDNQETADKIELINKVNNYLEDHLNEFSRVHEGYMKSLCSGGHNDNELLPRVLGTIYLAMGLLNAQTVSIGSVADGVREILYPS